MPQLSYVEHATRSPSACIICGAQKGPFVDCNVPQISFWTANGTATVDTSVYVCIGSRDNPGCAVQIGRITGEMVDVFKMHELGAVNHALNKQVAELTALVAKKTIRIADLVSAGYISAAEVTVV